MKQRNIFIFSAIIAAILSRLLPHPYNFTPMIGITLFGAATFSNKWLGGVISVLAWFLSDLVLNAVMYASITDGGHYFITPTFISVCLSLFVIMLIGQRLRGRIRIPGLVLSSLGASLLFFIFTNTATWVEYNMYPHTLEGWWTCMLAGIPFYRNEYGTVPGSLLAGQVLGDLFYTGILFGSYAWVFRKSLKSFSTH